MNLLAIDTSTERATVALMAKGCLIQAEQEGVRQHAQQLLPMVERLLAEAEIALSQLDGLVFGRGPGGFTGLRVACSVTKGLAYAHDLPVFPVSSLAAIADEVYAQGLATMHEPVLAMMDARMRQLYWGLFVSEQHDSQEQVSDAADVAFAEEPSSCVLAGVGFEPYVPLLPEATQTRITQQCSLFPRAEALIRIVQRGQVMAISATAALPTYLRNQITQA